MSGIDTKNDDTTPTDATKAHNTPEHSVAAGVQPSENYYKGWARPGPKPVGGVALEEGETLDFLCGHFRIFQYAKGHRFSVDDLMVAWFGTSWCPRAGRIADLGSGIGSVGMTAAWRCPGAIVHTIEAQSISARLARKSVAYNGLSSRYFIHEGDLRDTSILQDEEPFDLVLGSPPYWPVGSRLEAAHPQAIPARLEVRGTVYDYAARAATLLAAGGVFACVLPLDQTDRLVDAYIQAGLQPLHRQDVFFKEGDPYGICILAGSKIDDIPPNMRHHPAYPRVENPVVVRCTDGSVHPSIALLRLAVGFPPGAVHLPKS